MTLRPALALLTLCVLLAHAWLVQSLSSTLSRLGSGDVSMVRRIDVSFVSSLQPAEPPVAVQRMQRPAVPAPATVPKPPQAAASAPSDRQDEPQLPQPTPAEPVPEPPPTPALAQASEAPTPASPADPGVPTSTATAAAQPPASAASSPTAAAFEWPPSTRLSYRLTGDYRGPIHGTAQVEWLRTGDRYQVHLDVNVAPVLSRRMTSEGLLTDQGLRPLRYEEVTQVLLSSARRRTLRFEPDRVVMANGDVQPTLPNIQDSASQFVQLTWLFTTQRDRLQPGQVIEMPLALPRRVDRWVYDVQAEEELDTPVGRLRVLHMKPRRTTPQPGELVIETWFAPALQYLPVRILIRQDAQTFVDLTLSTAPLQAAKDAAAPGATGR
jgi:Protein of unknown function (DUF3108)